MLTKNPLFGAISLLVPTGPPKIKKPSKNGLRIMESAGSQRAK
jgi:hypothetical protein